MASFLDDPVGGGQQTCLRKVRQGRTVASPFRAVGTPETSIDLERQMMVHMPERAVLEAISITEHGRSRPDISNFGRGLSPRSRTPATATCGPPLSTAAALDPRRPHAISVGQYLPINWHLPIGAMLTLKTRVPPLKT